MVGEREERPTGCCRHAAVVLHCSVRSGPEKRNTRQEPAVMRSKAAEGLLCAGPGWLCLAEHPSASGPGLPSPGCTSPHGHGAAAALRLQDKRNDRDSAETWMSGDTRGWLEAILGGSLENISTAFEWFSWLTQWSRTVDYWSHSSWAMPVDWVFTSPGLSLVFRSFGVCLLSEAPLLPQQPCSLGQSLAVPASGASLPAGRSS